MKTPKHTGGKEWLWWLLPLPFVLWLGAILAQCWQPGVKLGGLLDNLTASFENPLALHWTERTAPICLVAVLLYAGIVAYNKSMSANTRLGEEHGSAEWGSPAHLNAKYANRQNQFDNIILTENVRIGTDTHKHRRNLNLLVVGGSGSGKSRAVAMPALLQAASESENPNACSYLITDPKAELLRTMAPLLIAKGYEIKVFNLVNVAQSDAFNPFPYMRSEADVLKMINNLIKNTTPRNAKGEDPFWEKSEIALLSALILFLYHEAPDYEKNFSTVMFMLENAAASEDNEEYRSPVDLVFEGLEEEQPEHIAVKQYKVFKQAAGKTAKSILVSAAVRLAAFNLSAIRRMTDYDDMDLGSLGERKRAIFCVIPDNGDTSFNYIIGMLYTCAFQELYYRADQLHGGVLPVPVRIIMDEFQNVPVPGGDDFGKILATCRSRQIFCNIIIQNMAALRAMFDKDWENITGNCDSLLYLGGNEQSTHEYISKLLGKSTIDTKTRGITRGRSGSSSENFQNTGRELMQPDEVRMLDNDYALLFIRGERPVIDRKYNLMRHPHIHLTAHGGAAPYEIAQTDYRQPDLSEPFTNLDDIEIIE